jgi:hypothetical protein
LSEEEGKRKDLLGVENRQKKKRRKKKESKVGRCGRNG